jgi:hypothetical protein
LANQRSTSALLADYFNTLFKGHGIVLPEMKRSISNNTVSGIDSTRRCYHQAMEYLGRITSNTYALGRPYFVTAAFAPAREASE